VQSVSTESPDQPHIYLTDFTDEHRFFLNSSQKIYAICDHLIPGQPHIYLTDFTDEHRFF